MQNYNNISHKSILLEEGDLPNEMIGIRRLDCKQLTHKSRTFPPFPLPKT